LKAKRGLYNLSRGPRINRKGSQSASLKSLNVILVKLSPDPVKVSNFVSSVQILSGRDVSQTFVGHVVMRNALKIIWTVWGTKFSLQRRDKKLQKFKVLFVIHKTVLEHTKSLSERPKCLFLFHCSRKSCFFTLQQLHRENVH